MSIYDRRIRHHNKHIQVLEKLPKGVKCEVATKPTTYHIISDALDRKQYI